MCMCVCKRKRERKRGEKERKRERDWEISGEIESERMRVRERMRARERESCVDMRLVDGRLLCVSLSFDASGRPKVLPDHWKTIMRKIKKTQL